MKNLSNKVVVITGAGSGIGRALAVNLAGKGARLALSDVNEEGLGETVELALKAGSPDVHTARLDVSDKAAFASYATEVAEHFGQVNVVINNAGVALAGDVDRPHATRTCEWIVGINFWGVVYRHQGVPAAPDRVR